MAGEMNLMDLGFRVVDFWIKLLLRNLKSQISNLTFQIPNSNPSRAPRGPRGLQNCIAFQIIADHEGYARQNSF